MVQPDVELQPSQSVLRALVLCQVNHMKAYNDGRPFTVLTIRPEEVDGISGWRCRFAEGEDKLIVARKLTPLSMPTLVPGIRVRCQFLHKELRLNGKTGVALEQCPKKVDLNRWFVRLEDGSGRKISSVNLVPLDTGPPEPEDGVLATGRRVRLHGLVRDIDLNGKLATLIEFDASKGRWNLRFDDGSGRRIKPEKLELLPPGEGLVEVVHRPSEADRARLTGQFMDEALEGQDGAEHGWYDVDPAYDPDNKARPSGGRVSLGAQSSEGDRRPLFSFRPKNREDGDGTASTESRRRRSDCRQS